MKTIKSQGFIPLVLLALICSVLRTRYNYVKKNTRIKQFENIVAKHETVCDSAHTSFFNEPMNNVLVQQFAECTLRWVVLRD